MVSESSTLVHHFLEESARAYPGKCALIYKKNRVSYTEINSYSNQLAKWLIERGVKKGDKIPFLFENSIEYVVTYYGILKAGAVAVSLDDQLNANRLMTIIHELDAKIVISSSRAEKTLLESDLQALQVHTLLIHVPKFQCPYNSIEIFQWDEVVKKETCLNLNIVVEASDLASIVYTSGSTGEPKGVMLSHQNIQANTKSICQYLKLTHEDIQLVVLPFYYVMGKSLLNTHFAVGGTVVINNQFAFPATVIKQMIDEKVTGFSGVPSTFTYLLNRSPLENNRDKLTSLRYCSQAGGYMSKQIKLRLKEVLPDHTEIYIMYGATEASARLTYLEPSRFSDKIDSIGKAIPGVAVKVLNEYGKDAEIGEVGEIVGSGENIMKGYYKDPETTARVLGYNGYHTGDLGYTDEEGFLYIVGRKDNLIKVGGHRINPDEIEDAIMESGLALETIVIGMPDKLLGNKLIAIVAPIHANVSVNDILEYCSTQLTRHKLPGEIKMVKSLPKFPNGKIDKKKCKEILTPQLII